MENINMHEHTDGITVDVRVQPRSSKNSIVGVYQGALKIMLNVPPVDGAANAACCELLAKQLGIAKSAVEILRGHTSRSKTVKIKNVKTEDIYKLLK